MNAPTQSLSRFCLVALALLLSPGWASAQGLLVNVSANEQMRLPRPDVIRSHHPRVGEVNLHFPRAGYDVVAA